VFSYTSHFVRHQNFWQKHSQHRAIRSLLWAVTWLLLFIGGCAPGYVRVTLKADAETNQGRPLRVLVRSVDEQSYRTETYSAVSALVIRPDATVLRSLTLEPRSGESRKLWIKSEKDKAMALYFFYTAPTASWKLWLRPALPWRLTVPLGRTGVKENDVRECRVFLK
jgi:hypothetical protein